MKQFLDHHQEKRAGIPPWLPARLDVQTVSRLLGFPEHDIPVLVAFPLAREVSVDTGPFENEVELSRFG